MKARTATAITAGTNQAATASACRWIGARERWALATMATICASVVSAPTRRASMTRLPVPLMVAPVTGSPAAFSTASGSPVSMLSSTDERPSTTSPSTGTFSPGRTRSRSPTRTSSSGDLRLAAVGTDPPRGPRRQPHQRADRRAGLLAGGELEDLPEQHQHHDHRGASK